MKSQWHNLAAPHRYLPLITVSYRLQPAAPCGQRAVAVIKICDRNGGMHGNAGGRIMGIMGIVGTVRIM